MPVMSQPKSVVLKTITDVSPIAYNKNGKIDYAFSSLLLTYNVLNISDLILTRRALDLGHEEGNPLMVGLVKNRPWDLITKVTVMMGANYLLKYTKNSSSLYAYILVSALIILYSYTNYINYKVVMDL